MTYVWRHCLGDQRIWVAKDQDFVFLANRPGDTGRLLWVRLGNCRNEALIRSIGAVLAMIIECFNNGRRIVEVR